VRGPLSRKPANGTRQFPNAGAQPREEHIQATQTPYGRYVGQVLVTCANVPPCSLGSARGYSQAHRNLKNEKSKADRIPNRNFLVSCIATRILIKVFDKNAATMLPGITAGILVWYSIETQRLRTTTVEASLFAALTRFHEAFSTQEMYKIKRVSADKVQG
jgi:hypothetical protein